MLWGLLIMQQHGFGILQKLQMQMHSIGLKLR